MKQRLLLSLLMLFVSVGLVKAANGNGTLVLTGITEKVTVSADANLSYGSSGWTNKGIEITPIAGTSSYTVNVSEAVTTLTISGKVNTCDLNHEKVKTLTFSENGNLTTLEISGALALTTVNANGNKLEKVDFNPQQKNCVVIGNQTLDAAGITINAKGSDVLSVIESKLEVLGTDLSEVTFSDWKAEKGTIVAKPYGASGKNFAFVDENGYYTSGKISCKVSKGKASVTLTGIEVTPANIRVDIIESPNNMWNESTGSITINGQSNNITVEQGSEITVTAAPNSNYEVSNFKTTGLVEGTLNGTVKKFTVKAKADSESPSVQEKVSIQALFKGKTQKVSFGSTLEERGTFKVYEIAQKEPGSTETIRTEWNSLSKEVAYGNELEIVAVPKDLYTVTYTINGEEPVAPNTLNKEFSKTYTANVRVKGAMDIAVTFTPNSIHQEYSFVLEGTDATYWADVFSSIQIKNSSVSLVNKPISDPVQFTAEPNSITAGETVSMVLNLNSDKKADYEINSIVVSGMKEPLKLTPLGNGKYSTSFIAPEEGNATFTIHVLTLKSIKVSYPNQANNSGKQLTAAQEFEYDGMAKPFQYTTTPPNLKLDVLYKEAGASDDSWTKDEPIAAGAYAVKYSRDAIAPYQAIEETLLTIVGINHSSDKKASESVLVINPAKVQIKTVPEVKAEKQDDGSYKYVIGSGEATALGKTVTGVFEVIGVNDDVIPDIASAQKIETVPGKDAKAHLAILRFKVQSNGKDDPNYQAVTTKVPVSIGDAVLENRTLTVNPNSVLIDYVATDKNIPVTVKVFNGAKEIGSSSEKVSVKVAKGSDLKVQVTVDGYKNVFLREVTTKDEVPMDYVTANIFECTLSNLETNAEYAISLKSEDEMKANLFKMEIIAKDGCVSTTYSAEAKALALKDIKITQEGADVTSTYFANLYYKDSETNQLVEGDPVNAGYYDAYLDIPMNMKEGYAGQQLVVKKALQIIKKTPNISWPTSVSMIGKGQKLGTANLRGGSAEIVGTFSWENPDERELTTGGHYAIVFTPNENDAKNYRTVTLSADDQKNMDNLAIIISEKPILSIVEAPNGKFIVKAGNSEYGDGTQVPENTQLTITALPNEGFELVSMTIDECGAITTTTSTSTTFTVEDKSVSISGSFRVKALPGNFKVTIPESDVRGAIISGGGEFVVAQGGSVSFTVSTLSADANKVSVTASNGTVTKGSNGRYTVSNIQANTTVRVSLSNPTPLKVEVQKSYLNNKKYHVGSVEIAEGESTTYYYGDVITVVAYPESGVKFEKWSDGSKEQVHEIELKGDMKVTATFSGIPTGIEDIESAAITTGKGFIMVKNVANAKVTVVSISGRLQAQEEVSGDTRIDVPQGIYVVVLESGSDVKRAKVIVK